ncbi:MAG: 4Fe-4S dicluster domain-containing protein, partial [bacterium]|nr:4Fe-4S dicluster domain-containing protein [bacterium]
MFAYLTGLLIVLIVIVMYLGKQHKKTGKTEKKIVQAKEDGVYEPVHISPYIDPGVCIGSGACITACPEKEVIGLSGGLGKLIHASRCIGHGACAIACPVNAITLVFGSETRGVDIPDVSPDFQTNVPGIYISGELGGMGLIKNSITQGKEAVFFIKESLQEYEGGD